MKISEVNRPRKINSNTAYIMLKDIDLATQIFRRSSVIRNDNVKKSMMVSIFIHF